jgi:Rrf2 family protein
MMALAADESGQAQPSAKLSEKLQIPLPFLHQIAHSLMQAGLIKASPGPRGGLRLNGDPGSITILKIAEVLEGPIVVTPCLDCADDCPRKEICTAQYMWGALQAKIVDHLSSYTLQSIINEEALQAQVARIEANGSNGKKPVPAD